MLMMLAARTTAAQRSWANSASATPACVILVAGRVEKCESCRLTRDRGSSSWVLHCSLLCSLKAVTDRQVTCSLQVETVGARNMKSWLVADVGPSISGVRLNNRQ